MRKLKYSIPTLLLALLLLAGCANTVRTRVSTYVEPQTDFGQGSIAVKPADPSMEDSLEFAHYQAKVEDRLRQQGYEIADPSEADYIARLGLAVTEKQPSRRAYPRMMFMTGFGPYWSDGIGTYYGRGIHPYDRWFYGDFYGPGYYDPWGRNLGPGYWRGGYGFSSGGFSYRGFAMDARQPRRAYTRKIDLAITRVTGSEPERVYEVEAVSRGGCSSMSAVVDEMLAAIFKDFPGENGATKTLRVEGEAGCG